MNSLAQVNGGVPAIKRRVNTTILKTLRKLKEDQRIETAELVGDLGADSLDRVTIVFDLEDEFGIAINDQQESAVVTVRDLVALVEGKVNGARQ